MIDLYVGYVIDKLKDYISANYDGKIEFIYSNYVNVAEENRIKNKIIVSVVNISYEAIDISAQRYIPNGNGYIIQKTPLMLYVYVLFRAYFDDDKFLEGLRALSLIASFFLTNSNFNIKDNNDMLQLGLKDFEVFLQKDYKDCIGKNICSYCPSLLYKIGLIEIMTTGQSKNVAAIKNI